MDLRTGIYVGPLDPSGVCEGLHLLIALVVQALPLDTIVVVGGLVKQPSRPSLMEQGVSWNGPAFHAAVTGIWTLNNRSHSFGDFLLPLVLCSACAVPRSASVISQHPPYIIIWAFVPFLSL